MARYDGPLTEMRKSFRPYKMLMAALALFTFSALALAQSPGNVVLFDDNWRFQRGGAQGAEATDFDDSRWQRLDLPHDWSIEDQPGKGTPFEEDRVQHPWCPPGELRDHTIPQELRGSRSHPGRRGRRSALRRP